MHLLTIRRSAPAAFCLLFALGLASCGDGRVSPVAPDDLSAARAASGGGGPKVDAVDPPFGRQGETAKEVAITGSGFGDDAVVAWERDGVIEDRIQVRSTEVKSSTEILVTIDIAPDTDLDLYDVSVTSTRKKGIGTEMFEVTAAISIGTLGGATLSRAVNDRGDVVGYSVVGTASRPFFWSPSSGMLELPGTPAGAGGAGWGIDAAGTVIVGIVAQYPVIWTRAANGAWEISGLPVDATSPGGRASSVASDPATGEASIIGGVERVEYGRRVIRQPRLWVRDQEAPHGWARVVLEVPATDASVWVEDVNARGQAVGSMLPLSGKPGQDRAVVWESDGRPSLIGPASSSAEGIDEAGTLILGRYDGVAAYWRRDPNEADGWAGPVQLPGGCSRAMDADSDGRIIAAYCRDGTRTTSAVFQPPSYSSPLHLGGLGDRDTGGVADAISLSGGWLAGGASLNGQDYAVVWRIF